VTQNSAIHDLREESGLRDEFAHHVRNILLPFRRERFLIAGATTKCDDHDFSSRRGSCGASPWGVPYGASESNTCGIAQKISASSGNQAANFAEVRCAPAI